MPLFTQLNPTLNQSNNAIDTSIAGVTTLIDSSIEDFQKDFHEKVINDNNSIQKFNQQAQISYIRKDKFQIMIAKSSDYRIFVIYKENVPDQIDLLFKNIVNEIQSNVIVDDVFNTDIIQPKIEQIINKHLRLTLLKPFTIDVSEFNNILKQKLFQKEHISPQIIFSLKLLILAREGTRVSNIKNINNIYNSYLHKKNLFLTKELNCTEMLIILDNTYQISPSVIYQMLNYAIDKRIIIPLRKESTN